MEKILLDHGAGGLLSNELVRDLFLPSFNNPLLAQLTDSAVLDIAGKRVCFTTDSFVVSPLFFPGGDIGSLAVHGTVNDLAACGGKPAWISAGFILEEGLPLGELRLIVASMQKAALRAGVQVVTGDTKVVPRGVADGVFINTSGIGIIEYPGRSAPSSIEPGDAIILNGSVGDHGAAVVSAREGLGSVSGPVSDSAPLNSLVEAVLGAGGRVHCMRDATRGGLGAVLAEISGQAQVGLEVHEHRILVKENVRGLCEIFGLDPLFMASEGRMAVFCHGDDAAEVLAAMRGHDLGRDSSIIGEVTGRSRVRAVIRTIAGGSRVLDLPAGEAVPRIC
mgnify:CR=1 FL=1